MTSLGSFGFGSSLTTVDLSVWTGVKLGIGFAIGVALVTLVVAAIVILVFRIDVAGIGASGSVDATLRIEATTESLTPPSLMSKWFPPAACEVRGG